MTDDGDPITLKVYSHSAQLFDASDSHQTGGDDWMKMWVSDGSGGYTEIAKSNLTLEYTITIDTTGVTFAAP